MSLLPLAARMLVAANPYWALTERPAQRPALSPERVAEELTYTANPLFATEINPYRASCPSPSALRGNNGEFSRCWPGLMLI